MSDSGKTARAANRAGCARTMSAMASFKSRASVLALAPLRELDTRRGDREHARLNAVAVHDAHGVLEAPDRKRKSVTHHSPGLIGKSGRTHGPEIAVRQDVRMNVNHTLRHRLLFHRSLSARRIAHFAATGWPAEPAVRLADTGNHPAGGCPSRGQKPNLPCAAPNGRGLMRSMTQCSQHLDLEADVVIVGYGPVGATLANLLGLRGVRTLVLERESSVYHLPRAVHFDDEVMRVFETLGLSDAIRPTVIPSIGMHFVDTEGKLILDWSRSSETTPQGWQTSYRFHQPELESILRSGVRRWPSVSVMTRCDVFALDEDFDGISVRFEDLSTGRLSRCRARYVVGCDGARSLVRRFMGCGMDDLGFHERWLVLDFILEPCRVRISATTACNFAIRAGRPPTSGRTGNRRRWEITLLPGRANARS